MFPCNGLCIVAKSLSSPYAACILTFQKQNSKCRRKSRTANMMCVGWRLCRLKVLPSKSMCIIYILCVGLFHIWQCEIMSSLTDILSMLCFVFVLCTNFTPPFGISILIPQLYPLATSYSHTCRVNFILCPVNLIHWGSVEFDLLWTLLTDGGQCIALGVVSCAGLAISRQRFLGQIRLDRATGEMALHSRGNLMMMCC